MKTYTSILAASSLLLLSACDGSYDSDDTPAPNQTPVAVSDISTTTTETLLSGRLEGTDADGDELTYSVATPPFYGTLNINANGSYSYLPDQEFTGIDSFTFTVSDGIESSTEATVAITINALELSFFAYSQAAFQQSRNDTPVSINGRIFVQENISDMAYDTELMLTP